MNEKFDNFDLNLDDLIKETASNPIINSKCKQICNQLGFNHNRLNQKRNNILALILINLKCKFLVI